MRQLSKRLLIRAMGLGLITFAVLAFFAPLAMGTWALQLLGFPLIAVGLANIYGTVTTSVDRLQPSSYAMGMLSIAAGLTLLVSPSLAMGGVVAALAIFLAVDGILKIGQVAFRRPVAASYTVSVLNGVWSLFLALAVWVLWRKVGVDIVIGITVAGYTAAAGWRMLVAPGGESEGGGAQAGNVHPDARLRLGEHALFRSVSESLAGSAAAVWQAEATWLVLLGLVLFATHLSRMKSAETWLGLISPLAATAGDAVMAVLLGTLLVLPLRLGWRRLTRPLERRAWRLRFSHDYERMATLPQRVIGGWTDARFSFSAALRDSRSSLPRATGLAIRLGLPLAALFVTINTIWGFTWYFNTESWASAVYQKVTELRVDKWRAGMVDAVASLNGGEDPGLFRMTPPGIEDGDFNFIVIGDTGEGDPSQYALIDSYQAIGRRDAVKFLVISSDVIYPAGAMADYEKNFYLPFKGFTKPIYAIPGNHDWFDALEGFNANFLEPRAARAALAARARVDLGLTSTVTGRIDSLLDRSKRLRQLYGIDNALQRAPFFEIQTTDFALIAIDTGILRTVDERERAWLTGALERARGKFIMAIVGHPKYAGGQDTSIGDDAFAALYSTLVRAGANVLMAGDWHDFEYYVESTRDGTRRPVFYFVNGGGGAYLSIGAALAWPDTASTETWALYPSPEALRAKLDAETPWWKQPFWAWIKRYGAWPLSVETLSGIFDFNHAPFYQSFMEVRVERSKNRVVCALYGVNGPIRWRDLRASFGGESGASPDDPVEFVAPMPMPTVANQREASRPK